MRGYSCSNTSERPKDVARLPPLRSAFQDQLPAGGGSDPPLGVALRRWLSKKSGVPLAVWITVVSGWYT